MHACCPLPIQEGMEVGGVLGARVWSSPIHLHTLCPPGSCVSPASRACIHQVTWTGFARGQAT